ncbi:sugar phosphate isomerase/epimerase family protein [Bacteroidota bacterium]
MKRREFLRTSLTGAAMVGLAPSILQACSSNDPLHDFGIISGVLSNELRDNPKETLTAIAEMGYKYLEFGGTFGMEVKEFKDFMADIGLKALAGGTNLAGLQGDGLKKLINEQLELDKKYLVCYWPWMNDPATMTKDDLKFALEQFHVIGEACNKNGLRFAYHNHDHEFWTKFDGEFPYDFFLRNSDPELVTMQFDLYWASVGGVDPVDYIKQYPGRFEMLHVKDALDLNERESFACPGEGVIDFERIFKLRETGGFKHLIVERDGCQHGIACARTSIDYMNSLNF